MFQGNWTCSKCGGDIKELPFEPRSNSGLTCRDCYFKEKDGPSAGGSESTSASEVDTGAGADMDDREVPDFDPEAMGASEPQADDGLEGATAAPASSERQIIQSPSIHPQT